MVNQITIHEKQESNIRKLGFYSSVVLTLLTVITFGIAIMTPPLSGPFCISDCYQYPYLDITSRFPRDYYWMLPAILLNLAFVPFLVSVHYNTRESKKFFSLTGLIFGVVSAAILVVDYVLQLSVIQPSLLRGEQDGIAILSQFNPHGIFIVLEEMGFSLQILALFCLVPVFSCESRLGKLISWIFISGFVLTFFSLILILAMYGIFREYRFEVAVISIDWLVLIISGILISAFFKKQI